MSNYITIEAKQDLLESLKQGIAKVTFTKLDGSDRVLNCTLMDGVIPAHVTEAKKLPIDVSNANALTVFDVDIKQWRAFRFDSVKEVVF